MWQLLKDDTALSKKNITGKFYLCSFAAECEWSRYSTDVHIRRHWQRPSQSRILRSVYKRSCRGHRRRSSHASSKLAAAAAAAAAASECWCSPQQQQQPQPLAERAGRAIPRPLFQDSHHIRPGLSTFRPAVLRVCHTDEGEHSVVLHNPNLPHPAKLPH